MSVNTPPEQEADVREGKNVLWVIAIASVVTLIVFVIAYLVLAYAGWLPFIV